MLSWQRKYHVFIFIQLAQWVVTICWPGMVDNNYHTPLPAQHLPYLWHRSRAGHWSLPALWSHELTYTFVSWFSKWGIINLAWLQLETSEILVMILELRSFSSVSIWQQTCLLHKVLFWTDLKYAKPLRSWPSYDVILISIEAKP